MRGAAHRIRGIDNDDVIRAVVGIASYELGRVGVDLMSVAYMWEYE